MGTIVCLKKIYSFYFGYKNIIFRKSHVLVQDLRLPHVVSIDFWQYKVEVEVEYSRPNFNTEEHRLLF